MTYLLLAIFGAAGAMARYAVGGVVHDWFGSRFPYGTFVVNILGCFAIGWLGTLADERLLLSPRWRMALLVGFLGAFTTFSSFAFESWNLLKEGSLAAAALNVGASVVCGFVALGVGVWVGR